jgi:hypothetical protein
MDQRYIERHQLPKKNFTEANIKSFYQLVVGFTTAYAISAYHH